MPATTNDQRPELTVGFIGCGNLGSAILSGLLFSSLDDAESQFSRFIVSVKSENTLSMLQDRFGDHADKISVYRNEQQKVARESSVVILAVDPADVEDVILGLDFGEVGQTGRNLFISVVAGWTRLRIEEVLLQKPSETPRPYIVRTLPNVAAVVHEGLTIIETPDVAVPADQLELVKKIFDCVGKTVVLDPRLLSAATAVGGSTPAFFAVICEALIDASVAVGVPRNVAHETIAQSMVGTARMLQTGMHPGMLKDKGTTPEGCTLAGLMVLEETAVRGHIGRALREAVTVARRMTSEEHVNDTRR